MLPKPFYKASITLIPNPKKDITRKENCLGTNFLNTILANLIQQYVKRIINQVGIIPGMYFWLNIQSNQLLVQKKKKMTISKD